MFKPNDITKILIPNVVNSGYDYRLADDATIGNFVLVSVMNKPYIGVIIGAGTSGLPPEKIKPVSRIYKDFNNLPIGLSGPDLAWIYKMAAWTMMTPGAVLKLILNISDAFDTPKIERLYNYIEPDITIRMTDKRQRVADAFASNDNEPMTISDIGQIAGVSNAVIHAMIDKNYLIPAGVQNKTKLPDMNYYDTGIVTLNDEQRAAADSIDLSKFSVTLLDGITGSGKTQVYFDTVMRAYDAGKNILLMMPEIALTAQFMSRFAARFGARPIVWHSNLTGARRREIWRGVATGEIRIVIGTRSALFLPWKNLGLIVVDEEHDTSYKQEDMGNYHARDMAILRAKIANFPVVLASATPSAETVKNIKTGNYKSVKLTSRFGGAVIPTIELIDMRKIPRIGGGTENNRSENSHNAISETMSAAISETIAAGKQVMLFINRRGYSPIVQCKKCGWHADCPDCSVGMVYHKNSPLGGGAPQGLGWLLCHICGRRAPMPRACPDCVATELFMTGLGIEKLADEVAEKFPTARAALVSSDTMQSRQALERLVSQMENGEIDIIIGTQILAKGHHFPNLTLVGVVDSDMGLFSTDFRSGEKTFQQLFQVAGRAGRGAFPGRVMLQTYQPEHPVLRAIVAGDRDKLMDMDLSGRCAANMPPYGQLIAVIISGEKESMLKKFCADLAANAPTAAGVKVFGPIPAQIYQIRNWYRMRFLISAGEKVRVQDFANHWLANIKTPSNIKIKIDVNPQNFM